MVKADFRGDLVVKETVAKPVGTEEIKIAIPEILISSSDEESSSSSSELDKTPNLFEALN